MDDQTKNETLTMVEEGKFAIGIQFSIAYSGNRSLVMTTGCPLDWTETEINKVLRKLAHVSDSLDGIYRLRELKASLERWENEHKNVVQQIANAEAMNATQWDRSGRKGEMKLNAQQQANLANFKGTKERIAFEVKKTKEEIAKLEAERDA